MINFAAMTRRRILVPIDFKPQSEAALNYARKIASKQNDMISCIYVMEEEGLTSEKKPEEKNELRKRRDAENKLSEKVHSVWKAEDKIPFELIVTSGKVYKKIVEKAVDLNVRLIIMGSSGCLYNKKSSIGRNTKKILLKSHVPVITLRSNHSADDSYIIVPVDLFKPFGNQIKCAVDMARLLGAGVCVLSVIERGMLGLEPVYKSRLRDIRQLLRDMDISCTSRLQLAQSTVAEEILSFANRIDSGLILIMSQHETEKGSSKLGSTAREVIVNAEVPVQSISTNFVSRFAVEDYRPINDYQDI
jgi:nucleotide-binding universal stress UspA family protein